MKKAIVIGLTAVSAIVMLLGIAAYGYGFRYNKRDGLNLIASIETCTTDSGYSYTYTSRYSHLDNLDLIKTAIQAKELG